MKTGIDLITKEREEQIHKHGFDVVKDVENLIHDLKAIRGYFGEFDQTAAQHRMYSLADKAIKQVSELQNRLSVKPELPDLSDWYIAYHESEMESYNVYEKRECAAKKHLLKHLRDKNIITLNAIK